MTMEKKSRIWKIAALAALILCALVLLCFFSARRSERTLIVTHYEVTAPLRQAMRLVQLSDLHNHEFGEENGSLVARVRELEPDLILLTGDMLNGDEEDTAVMLRLVRDLRELAPVYCCLGNHELQWQRNFGGDLSAMLEEAGAVVLEGEYLDVEYLGNRLRIGGYANYYRAPVMTTSDPEERRRDLQFADDFEDTDRYKILLNHIPTVWLDWQYRHEYPVDLVFCGHYHGGLVRLPLIGGLYAPNIGFFPRYTKGLFPGIKAKVVLSAGLSFSGRGARINNPGEIVCVDLLPEK